MVQYVGVSPEQRSVCVRFGVEAWAVDPNLKAGVAANVRQGLTPLNGLRHPPTNGTSGWYLWAGEEFSEDERFFLPHHQRHLDEWCPEAIPYLALPPGWRFLIAPGCEDVWFDASLLQV